MQKWMLMCWVVSALVWAEDCPNGDDCVEGQTCCSSPANGYACCPFEQAECCEDHVHCCPKDTDCDVEASSCVNETTSVPWAEGTSAPSPTLSKSFRMVRSYDTEDDDNICPDESRCPPEYSCLRALTRFNCCPLTKGISCSDGKHCCPEGHQCSADSRSCIRKEFVSPVICSDGESECPEETTCCENADSSWGCCPIPEATCCEDMAHCCPGGSACDVQQSKCVSLSTNKEMPMWAKLPARKIAEWERAKEDEQETVSAISGEESIETPAEITTEWPPAAPLEDATEPPTLEITTTGNGVPCNESVACLDGETCCKTRSKNWGCCPLPKAVCCEDLIHCCPHGTTCNPEEDTCDNGSTQQPWVEKSEAFPRQAAVEGGAPCDSTLSCPESSSCCKNLLGDWACCPLPANPSGQKPSGPEPSGEMGAASTTLLTTTTTTSAEASTQRPADTNAEEETSEQEVSEGGKVKCDPFTMCPNGMTCCFMTTAQKWGCCPIPQAVCCLGGEHCCPTDYKCDLSKGTCYKGEVAIPWYTKVPALVDDSVAPDSAPCDGETRCPVYFTCCPLTSGQWGCCPLYEAVCCPDQEHCCPWGYSCNTLTASCQRVTMVKLHSIPFTRVVLPQPQPQLHGLAEVIHCQGNYVCPEEETCCPISSDAWACCSSPNAVCCSDMKHCCPAGHTCSEGGTCTRNVMLHWKNWHLFFSRPEMRAHAL